MEGEPVTYPSYGFSKNSVYGNDTLDSLTINLTNALVGEDVTAPKGMAVGITCINPDGNIHGMWLQELMGYATMEKTVSHSVSGDGLVETSPSLETSADCERI
jgi:hypothetical protein